MAEYRGIDLSKWNDKIDIPTDDADFSKIKNGGYDFVFIRSGIGVYYDPKNTGSDVQKDPQFENFYSKAKAVGLKVGTYHYTYAKSPAEAIQEAEVTKQRIAGKQFEYPIVFDIEDPSIAGLGKDQLTAITLAYCDTMAAAGYFVAIYANANWFRNLLDTPKLTAYDKWLAYWGSNRPNDLQCDIWQYTSDGAVDGLVGRVDMSISYKDYESIIKEKGLNGFGNAIPVNPQPVTPIPTPEPIHIVAEPEPVVTYQAYAQSRWLSAVVELADFAGLDDIPILGIKAWSSKGHIELQAHTVNGKWWSIVDHADNDSDGYAGSIKSGSAIDCIHARLVGVDGYKLRIRVAPIGGGFGDYYSWVNKWDDSSSGYAGIFGKKIERIQMDIVKA